MIIKLIKPTKLHEDAYMGYAREWESENEEIIPMSAQINGGDYDQWLDNLLQLSKIETCPAGFVPAETFFGMDNFGHIVGVINIRHYLNEYLAHTGGHLAYGVRPSERNKGYAIAMIEEIKKYAKDILLLDKLLVTCNKRNLISAKTIVTSGGILEDERIDEEDGELTQRYWISLDY